MCTHLFDLPPEIREEIYKYLSRDDLLNLSCCSKKMKESLEHILWRDVCVTWESITKSSNALLKFAKSISFCFQDDSNVGSGLCYHYDYNCYFKVSSDVKVLSKMIIDKAECENVYLFQCLEHYCSLVRLYSVQRAFEKFLNLQEVFLEGFMFIDNTYCLYGISNLILLKSLSLSKCGLSQIDIEEISKLTSLKKLWLYYCFFSELFQSSDFKCLKSLQKLEVVATKNCKLINDSVIEYLKDFSHLQTLDLASTNISDRSMHLISEKFNNLQCLNVSACRNIGDNGIKSITRLPKLESLDISFNSNISSHSKVYLEGVAEKLKTLIVSETSVAANCTHTYLKKCKCLKELICNNNRLSIVDFYVICKYCVSLEKLMIQDNKLNQVKFEHITNLLNLRKLDISWNTITVAELIHVSKLKKLEELDISETKITNEGLACLQVLPSLRHLSLQGNSCLTDTCIKNLRGFPSLRYLSAAGTSIHFHSFDVLKNSKGILVEVTNDYF